MPPDSHCTVSHLTLAPWRACLRGVGLMGIFWLLSTAPAQALPASGAQQGASGQLPGTSGGQTAEVMEDHKLQQMRMENEGGAFHLIIPLSVPFADFSLDAPPRIIIDLDQTTSCLPKAPGLYQVMLDRGPVVSLRTSQYHYSPLDHRVRISLELKSVLPYEVRRTGEGIDVRIPDPEPRTPRALRLGSTGLAAVGDDLSDGEGKPVIRTAVSAERPVVPAPAPETAQTASSSQFRSLREALAAAVGEINVQALDPGRPDEVLMASPVAAEPATAPAAPEPSPEDAAAPAGDPPRSSPQRTEDQPVAEERAVDQPAEDPPHATPPSKTAQALPHRPTLGPARTPVTPVRAEDTPELATQPGKATYIVPGDPRETGAGRLLRKAAQGLLEGDEAKAQTAVERVLRFYPDTKSAGQAGLLLRELLVLQGKDIEADRVETSPTAPDTARISLGVFLYLVHRYEGRSDLMEVDRLLRAWGPAYGPVTALSSLHLALGEAFLKARRNDLARTHLELVPAGDPHEPRALALLAQAEEASGAKDKALELYRHLSVMSPGPYQIRAVVRSADLEFQQGQVKEALASYESFLAGQPPADEEPWALYQSANCHALLGDPGQAKLRYETVVGRWPQSYWASFAQAQLEEMKWRTDLTSK